ncbi:hypothetical protein D1872_301030 [compost metagenome]
MANSNAFEINVTPYPFWVLALGIGNLVLLALLTLGFYKVTHKRRKVKQATAETETL